MSATFNDLFNAGGAGQVAQIAQYEFVTTSKTVRALRDGRLHVMAVAGSGSGAAIVNAGFAGGPSAGEIATKRGIPVKAGDEFIVIIGAGGDPVTRAAAAAGMTAGNDGFPTTVNGPGVAITVNGGKGAPVAAVLPVSGAIGGTGGTGGDIHLPGGDGGDVIATTSTSAAAGGGAVGYTGRPASVRKGGSINSTAAAVVAAGAGVGGVGGSAKGAGNPSGGGSGGGGVDSTSATHAAVGGVNFMGRLSQSSPSEFIQSFASWGVDAFGGGGTSNASSMVAPGPGGGTPAFVGNPNSVARPGIFAGAGSLSVTGTGALQAGNHGTGASAVVVAGNGSFTATSGRGGDGCAILIFTLE